MKNVFIALFLVICYFPCCGQELIHNPSFEEYSNDADSCELSQIGDLDKYILSWSAEKTSPDIITAKACDYFDQVPYHGDVCIGILNYSLLRNTMSDQVDAEWISAELKDVLTPAQTYEFSVATAWMSSAHGNRLSKLLKKRTEVVRSNQASVCFYRSKYGMRDSLRTCLTLGDSNQNVWTQQQFRFTPKTDYDAIWIGNTDVRNTRISSYRIRSNYVISYVYLDNLSLKKLDAPKPTPKPIDTVFIRELILDNFEVGQYTLTEKHRHAIDQLLATNLEIVEIVGYADALGSYLRNEKLSQLRANSVYKYIQQQTLSTGSIRLLHHGERMAQGLISGTERKVIVRYRE